MDWGGKLVAPPSKLQEAHSSLFMPATQIWQRAWCPLSLFTAILSIPYASKMGACILGKYPKHRERRRHACMKETDWQCLIWLGSFENILISYSVRAFGVVLVQEVTGKGDVYYWLGSPITTYESEFVWLDLLGTETVLHKWLIQNSMLSLGGFTFGFT